MATSATRMSLPISTRGISAAHAVRRRVTPEAGRALEKLGHAIEYLTDEMVERGGPETLNPAEMQAVKILMEINHSIYNDCPEETGVADRLKALLHRFGV